MYAPKKHCNITSRLIMKKSIKIFIPLYLLIYNSISFSSDELSTASSSSGETVEVWRGPDAEFVNIPSQISLKREISTASSSSGETVEVWKGPSAFDEKPRKKTKYLKYSSSSKITNPDLQEKLENLIDEYQVSEDVFLRDYQKKALLELLGAFKVGQKKVGVEMPTCTGKTALFSALISLIQKSDLPYKIVVAVPTTALVGQTVEKFKQYNSTLDSLNSEIGVWYQKEKNIQPITVTTNQSLTSMWGKLDSTPYQASNWSDPEDYFHPHNTSTLVIFDEAHRTSGKKIEGIIKKMPANRFIVGFSASLSDYKKLPLNIVSKLNLREAVESKAITGIQFIDIDFSNHPNLNYLRSAIKTNGKDLSKEQIEVIDALMSKTSGISLSVAQVIKNIFISKDRNAKIMIFTNTKDHADNLKDVFNSIGMNSLTYHGSMSRDEIEQNNFKFKSDDRYNIMISCGMLDEGFDLPSVKVVIDFGVYVEKQRRLVQRLGRATRLSNKYDSAKYVRVKILSDDGESVQLNPRSIGLLGPVGTNISHFGVPDSDLLKWDVPFHLESVLLGDHKISPYDARLTLPGSENTILLKEGSFEEEEDFGDPFDGTQEPDEEFINFLDSFNF